MDRLFRDFQQAHLNGSGHALSRTITPIAPLEDPKRLRSFYNASNSSSIQQDIRSGILSHANTEVRFLKAEGNAWVDVYVAYWKAVGEILSVQSNKTSDGLRVFDAWKEVTNALIRGYSNAGFQAWTVPCLYTAGKYLRIFAIKADENTRAKGGTAFSSAVQDDTTVDAGSNEKLEEAARVINRIFTLCISDRYVAYTQRSLLWTFSCGLWLRSFNQGTCRRVQKMGLILHNKSPI